MPRRASPLECPAEEKAALLTIRKNRTEDTRIIERAKIVLARLNGRGVRQVARDMKVSVPTVSKWCKRFLLKGVAGLRDDPRPGKPAQYDSAFRDSVLELLVQPPPGGLASWDGPAIAEKLGASEDAVWRILRREGIYLRRRRNWRIATNPDYVPKNAQIVGLYLNPPLNALLLSVGEPTGPEGIEEFSGFVETGSAAVVRSLKKARRRQGALTLAAAIEAGTGQLRAPVTERQRWADFQKFLDAVIEHHPQGFELHGILDCSLRDRDWLKASEQRLECHFTPTSTHWLSLIQIIFSLLRVGNAKRGDKAEEGLRAAIEALIRNPDGQPKPFRWRKVKSNTASLWIQK
jgi:transposase